MTIRFTLAEKWQDRWFRKLTLAEKLLFIYMCDNCNIAGIWEADLEQASFSIGCSLEVIQGAYKGLIRGYETLNDTHVWIKNFLKHQRNLPLNPSNAAHATIINLLLPYKDLSENILQLLSTEQIKGLTRGLQSPLSISISKSTSKSRSKSKREYSAEFENFWKKYPARWIKSSDSRVKEGKWLAFEQWNKLSQSEQQHIMQIVSKLRTKESTPDAWRWLRDRKWEDYELPKPKQEPLKGVPVPQMKGISEKAKPMDVAQKQIKDLGVKL